MPSRSGASTSRARLQDENERLQSQIQDFFDRDKVQTLADIKERLGEIILPFETKAVVFKEFVLFVKLNTSPDCVVTLQYCLKVKEDLKFELDVDGERLANKKVRHLLVPGSDRIDSLTTVSNILSFLASIANTDVTVEDLISSFLSKLKQTSIDDTTVYRKVHFLGEQLSLSLVTPKRRRFSPDLLACAALWETTSPALYRQILSENILTLPSLNRIHQLSKALVTEVGMSQSTTAYLRARVQNLSDRERIVVLMIDEIYCAQRVEYVGGKLYGLEDGKPVKTVLAFMIKSIAGQYIDVVALFPITRLDASVLMTQYTKVLETLTEVGFQVRENLDSQPKT